MKTLTAFLLLILALPALGQLKITDYPDLGAAIDSGDWLLMHDTSAGAYRKIGPANLLASKQDISPTLTQIAGLTDPNADRLLFWDDSAGTGGEWKHLTLGTGLSITDTTLNGSGGLSITGTRVPYGDGAGAATSEAGFEYDATLNILRAGAFNMAGTLGLSTNGSGFLTVTNIFSGEDLSLNLGVGGGNTAFLTSTTGVNLWDFGSMDVKVPTEAYDATGWNGDLTVPTKDAVRDKIEAIVVGSAGLTATHVGYGDGSNNLTGEAGFEYNATTNTLSVPNLSVTTLDTTNLNADGLFLVEEEGTGTQTMEIFTSSAFTANRRLGLLIPNADVDLNIPATITAAGTDYVNLWADGIKQTFNPNGTNAGVNVGSHAGDPSSPANGDLWYDSTANELTARINGANVALGAGGASTGSFGITVDGGGAVLTSGSKGFVVIPFACTITGWSIVADQSGSVAFGVEKAADGVIPTTSIVASAAPALSSAQILRSTTLTGWTTSVAANDVIEFLVSGSPATITRATLQIHYTR